MRTGPFVMAKSVVSLLFALALGLFPAAFLGFLGMSTEPTALVLGRLVAAFLVGTAAGCWFLRGEAGTRLGRGMLLAFFVQDSLSTLMLLWGQLSGSVNAWGWAIVTVCALFAIGVGYLRFAAPAEARSAAVPSV